MSEPTNDDRPRPVPTAPVPTAPAPPDAGPGVPAPAPPITPGASASTADAPRRDPDLGEHATGDIVIDSALQDLRDAPDDDLDAQIEAGRRVHQTLQGRLSHLGGE